ncbi:MAG: ATP-dependent Clp protease ATP-binding subunit [Deltaproteobacteria bacterium]|nr:ATP-dependent Clp protease ATP-binding subunit [Deltaproteobacteria bacterium]
MKVSVNTVLRYSEALDRFVRVRSFTETETQRLLGGARFRNRDEYVRFLLGLCIPEFPAEILPHLLERGPEGEERRRIEDALYQLCVDVNPHLDITRVSVPVTEGEAETHLYLVEPRQEEAPGEADRVLRLEELLERQVVGQREAVEKLARVLRRAAAGLKDPDRPVGSFFFLGQTGVGKTELAKALVRVLYPGEDRLVRVDCSEYAQSHEYAKLIGAPPGYIGHGEGGYLTDAVMARGPCVVLFDEIEKAHPKLHQLLLQVLDEGILTDSKGRKVSFRDAVIIMTSNVGTREVEELDRRAGFGVCTGCEEVESESLKALRAEFPPEFVNRIDEVIVFRPLSREASLKICELILKEVEGYLEPRRLAIDFDPEVKEFLVEEGTDPRYGARPLRRTIRRHVLDPLATELLSGKFRPPARIRTHLRRRKVWFEAA